MTWLIVGNQFRAPGISRLLNKIGVKNKLKLQIAAKLSLGICLIFTVVTVTPFFAAAEQGPQVKVGSYNIAAGVGEDGEFDIERTADTIRESGADIIGLQEVDVHWSERSDFVDQVEYLADELEMEAFFAPIYSIESDQPEDLPMEYGLAVLSKYPIVDANNHEIARLSTQDPSPEPTLTPGFPEVLISVDGANVWFYNTHLDYRGDPPPPDRERELF
jgi:endonuclease/exonuclease/phosphatase family metal-dependent hydrolase